MSKMAAIVVGAGKSDRFGGNESKIFAKIDNQPLFIRALQLFINREDVCQTIFVVGPHDAEHMKTKFGANLGFMGVKLVVGGAHRCQSVANGLKEVSDDAKFVAVHDAARVCVAEQWIDAVFDGARKAGAAAPVVAVTSTLKRVGADHTIGETVPRDGLYLAQTPQIFRKDILVEAYANFADKIAGPEAPFTDDAQLVGAAGVSVLAVDGDARNIKITTHGDLGVAAALIKTLPQKPIARRGAFEEAQW
jgi:2-C-methyl-D-erythritol 4-phosphate cytidylyltransferase